MIDWDAGQSDKFIGTTAAILTAVAAASSAGASIYSAHKQSSAATDAAKLTTDAANHGADLADAATQRAEAFQRQQAEQGWKSGEQTQKANYDQWAAKQRAITGTLGQQLGINYNVPDYVPGVDPRFDTGSGPMGGAGTLGSTVGATPAAPSGGGDAASLKALLEGGMDPQAAVAKFNQTYGRTTGNEAVYYDPSQHGGVATIGLPDAYLAKPGASWDITQRSGGGAPAKAPGTLASFAAPSFMTPTRAPLPTPYQPGTIGAYVRRA